MGSHNNNGTESSVALPATAKDYHALHDNLVAELDALLCEDDEGGAMMNSSHAERIAYLTSALQKLHELTDTRDRGATPSLNAERGGNR